MVSEAFVVIELSIGSGGNPTSQLPNDMRAARAIIPHSVDGRQFAASGKEKGGSAPHILSGGGCPPTTLPEIFELGDSIRGEFVVTSTCALVYRRYCTHGGVTTKDSAILSLDFCGYTCNVNCSTPICFKWIVPSFPDSAVVLQPLTCEQENSRIIRAIVDGQVGACIEKSGEHIKQQYMDSCAAPKNVRDTFSIEYSLGY